MVTVECRQCGRAIQTFPSRVSRTKFCGKECVAKHLKTKTGDKHPMFGRKHRPDSLQKMKEMKRLTTKRGSESPTWKGGRFISSRGYVMITVPGRKKSVPEHRVVMERILGRPLLSSEVVHHRNGIKHDNRPENLELMDAATHKMEHQAVVKELRKMRAENERLRCLLAMYLPDGVSISELLEK